MNHSASYLSAQKNQEYKDNQRNKTERDGEWARRLDKHDLLKYKRNNGAVRLLLKSYPDTWYYMANGFLITKKQISGHYIGSLKKRIRMGIIKLS